MPSKTAVLVHFYFGEKSYLNRLAQETVPVWRALQGYDRAVLLRHETDLGKGRHRIELSERAEREADVIALPTKENFVHHLNELGRQGYVVDLFIFSHGFENLFLASKGKYGDNEALTGAYIREHVDPLKLRMVWGTHCYGSTLLDDWKAIGAKSASGARYVNFYPTRFKAFVKRWRRGEPLRTCLSGAKASTPRTPVHAYIIGDALARTKKWGGNPLRAARVLGKNEDARRYFEGCWLEEGEWNPRLSGRQNMNYSSLMLTTGNRSITSKTVW